MKPRFKRDLKFMASVEDVDWVGRELLPIWNKSQNGGLLLLQPDAHLYVVPFELSAVQKSVSGRIKPIVCDLCYTWRTSGAAGYVTFYPDATPNDSISFLCCHDLKCSDHARTKTDVGIQSRAQLRENLDDDARVERLRRKLLRLVETLRLEAIRDDL